MRELRANRFFALVGNYVIKVLKQFVDLPYRDRDRLARPGVVSGCARTGVERHGQAGRGFLPSPARPCGEVAKVYLYLDRDSR